MSIIDSLKKLIGLKTDEVVVAAKEKAEEVVPAPVVEEKVEEVAQVIEQAPVITPEPVIETPVQEITPEVTTAVEQVNDTMQDIGAMVEDAAPKTDDSIMGDNQ